MQQWIVENLHWLLLAQLAIDVYLLIGVTYCAKAVVLIGDKVFLKK